MSELDSKLLSVIPDCPRSAKESFAANFDWSMLASSSLLNGLQNGLKKSEKLAGNAVETAHTKSEKLVGNPEPNTVTNDHGEKHI